MRLRVLSALVLAALAFCPGSPAVGEPGGIGRADMLADGFVSVDEDAVRVERLGDGVRVVVPVVSTATTPLSATLGASLTAVSGNLVAPYLPTGVDLQPGLTEASVVLPTLSQWTWDHPEGVILNWTLRVNTGESVQLEGSKALTESQRPLRLLVSLPPEPQSGVPTRFQATVTKLDGTAAGGAGFRIRGGWFGGLPGGFAPDIAFAPEELLFDGTADEFGVVSGEFSVAAGSFGVWITFEAEFQGATAVISEYIEFQDVGLAEGRVAVTTDKPRYQPAQDVHVRAVSLRPLDRLPAEDEILTHRVRDPKGTLVFSEDLEVDRFGITHFTFPLADELLFGDYTVEVAGDGFEGSASFSVDLYELPRFSPQIVLDEPFVKPGQVLRGRVELAYTFGEPVRGATVVVDLLRQAGDDTPQDSDTLRTGGNGTARFKVTVPAHFPEQEIRDGTARVHLRVRAVDRAEQTAESTRAIPVSDGPLTVRLVSETGTLVEGIANVIHVAVSDPGGRPVVADVTLTAGGAAVGTATTDERGYVRVLTTPLPDVGGITATATAGDDTVTQTFPLGPDGGGGYLLARPDAAIVSVGETLTIDLACSAAGGEAIVEIRSGGRALETTQVALPDGTGRLTYDATPDALGEIEIAARALDGQGRLLQDRRTVVVDRGDELNVSVSPDRAEYEPAENGELSLHVTGNDGSGVEAELGVTAVDEAVYLLTSGRVGTEALDAGDTGLDGTESFGGGGSLGDLLAGDRTAADQDLAAAILAARRQAGGTLSNADAHAGGEVYAAYDRIYDDGWWIARRLRRKGRVQRRRMIRSGRFVDPWGVPYAISFQGRPREVLVASAGADETFDTLDDVGFVYQLRRKRSRRRAAVLIGFFDEPVGGQLQDGGIVGAPVFPGQGQAFGGPDAEDGGGAAPAPLPETVVRRFFPETLLAVPDLVTAPDGRATLPFTLADNITTWRVTALASAADGRSGSGGAALTVQKEMFVDLGLPGAFTAGDEIEVPVVAYNLTGADRDVNLRLVEAPWFQATSGLTRRLSVPAGSAARGSFGIRVTGTGDVALRVDATSGALIDAVEMPARVAPDARPVTFTRSGQVTDAVTETITIPVSALPGETSMQVHVLPGVLSQTLDGLDALLAEPYGCFEQTTSTTYPNAVVLDYLEQSGTVDRETKARAKRLLTQGLQRLLTFEVDGGGFSLWGDAPSSVILSGYAVQQFEDIAKVRHVDPALIQRTAAWLVAQQKANGSWEPETGGVHFGNSTDPLRVTAYIAWVLADAGRAPAALEDALAYLRANIGGSDDLYTRVVAANALLAADPGDPTGLSLLTALLGDRISDESGTWWPYAASEGRGMLSSSGHGANVEATAMMVQALLAGGGHADVVTDVLKFLAGARSEYGGWGGTFATVWTIKAFIAALPVAGGGGTGALAIRVNGTEAAVVPYDVRDTPTTVDVSEFVVPGANTVQLVPSGDAEPYYRISGRYVIPWSEPVPEPEALDVDVELGPARIRAGRGATLTLTVGNRRPSGAAEQVTAVVALPPGFAADELGLKDLVDEGAIDRFELRGGTINLYLGRIDRGGSKKITFDVHPTLRGVVTLPHTDAYEYYDPASRGASRPVRVNVR